MSKSKKAPVQSARARARSVKKLSAMIEREVQPRLGPNSTFEQRNDVTAEIIKEAALQRSMAGVRGKNALEIASDTAAVMTTPNVHGRERLGRARREQGRADRRLSRERGARGRHGGAQ